MVYDDCIRHCLHTHHLLPQWYLLKKQGEIIGGAGLITDDFISHIDLYPWLCTLYIDPKHRGNNYAAFLIEKAKADAHHAGFTDMNLSPTISAITKNSVLPISGKAITLGKKAR